MVKRGCGFRHQAGCYAECGFAGGGKPLEFFVLCPPVVVDTKAMGIMAKGVKLLKETDRDVWHVWDQVGSKYYPNVTDFLEEIRSFGLSRRLPENLNFSKLTADSRIWLLHSHAWINDPLPYHEQRLGGDVLGKKWTTCPKGKHDDDYREMCSGLWWEDVDGLKDLDDRIGRREMPSFEYVAAKSPEADHKGYTLAVFAGFPLRHLAVVRSDDGAHEKVFESARKAGVPCDVVEE